MRTKTYRRAATAALLAGAALGTSHCAGQSPRPMEAAAWAPPAPLGATTDASPNPNFTARGRVFFGLHPNYNPGIAVDELLVAHPSGRDSVHQARPRGGRGGDDHRPGLDRRASGRKHALQLRVYPDGSFDGAERYEDGSASLYERTTYQPLEKELFDVARRRRAIRRVRRVRRRRRAVSGELASRTTATPSASLAT